MTDIPTPAEIQKVRRWECASTGHDYDEIEVFGVDAPVAVVCRNCGGHWDVVR